MKSGEQIKSNAFCKYIKPNTSIILFVVLALYLIYKFLYTALFKIAKVGDPVFSGKASAVVVVFGIVISLVFAFAYYLIFIKQEKIEKVFLAFFPALALAYMLMFLPGGVPDEFAHFYSSYKISNILLLNFEQIGMENVLVRADDIKNSLLYSEMKVDNYVDFIKNFKFFAGDVSLQEYGTLTATSNTLLGYVPPAIGVSIGRIFKLSMPMIFYMGRIANAAFYCALIYRAIKISPIGKNFILVFSLLPMNLHLAASHSYDVATNAIALLFVAEILRLYYAEEKIGIKQIAVLCVFSFVLSPSKMVYLPLCAIPLIFKKERFEEKYQSKHWWLKASVLVFGVLSIFLFQLPRLLSFGNNVASSHIVAWAGEEGYTLQYVLQNPIHTIKIYIDTIRSKGAYYIQTAIGSSLCWLNVNMPFISYIPFLILMAFSLLNKENQPKPFCVWQKIFILVITLASAGLVLTSMFLAWTPISSPIITGVQGRYFLPLLMPLFIVLRGDKLIIKEAASQKLTLITLFFSANYIFEILISAWV